MKWLFLSKSYVTDEIEIQGGTVVSNKTAIKNLIIYNLMPMKQI